jgi:eukaryotic-like serine/threonine-protein kinase
MVSHALATQSYEPSAAMPPAPKQIGRFEVRSEIGRGSNGVVYAAFDPVLGREVAIKAIPLAADNQMRRRAETNFLQEAKSAAGLNHPGIVTVFDAGKTESVAYIAMERLYGNDLHDWLTLRNKLAPRAIASMMARVADAVHYAHRRGLIHRDLKPSNIFLTRDMKPKVLDFGVALAQYSDTPLTINRQLIGTPNYMSPEQALGRSLDARSDVFSMGAILYELLTGQRAFDGRQVEETLTKVASQQPTPIPMINAEVPAELVQIVERAMAKDPSERYQTAAEMRNDLVFMASRDDTGRRGTLPPPGTLEKISPNKTVRIALAAAAVLVAAVVVGLQQSHRSSETAASPEAGTSAQIPVVTPGLAEQAVNEHRTATRPEPSARAAPPAEAVPKPPVAAPVTRAPKVHPRPVHPVVAAGPPAPAPAPVAPPPADGNLMLGITPWGEIVVDGASRGYSPPLTHMTLPTGVHTIEVRNGSSPAFVSRIDLQPGQSIEIKHRF